MRLESELDRLGIKYTTEIINNTKFIRTENNIRVLISKDSVTLSTNNDNCTLPPTIDSLRYILEVIKNG